MERAEAESVTQAAAEWDARLRAPGCTQAEREQFASWRDASPAHGAAFERLQLIVSRLREERSRADLRALRDAALALGAKRRRLLGWSAAASVACLALAALVWMQTPALNAFLAGGDTYRTAPGQRSTVMLRDGSTVELNSMTRVRASITNERRFVELLDGQAIFNVARDPSRPFVVRARDREIVALGTAFDVRLDQDELRVTLLEGKVAVRPPGSKATVQAASREAEASTSVRIDTAEGDIDAVILMPGQQLVIDQRKPSRARPGAGPVIQQIDVEKATSWREGRIFLADLTLPQAVEEMNRHSTTRIVIEDPALEQLRINGMFRAGEQHAFARALEEYFGIHAQPRGESEIVLNKRLGNVARESGVGSRESGVGSRESGIGK